MWCFGDSFDLYASSADLTGYWDTVTGTHVVNDPGRFTGGQAWRPAFSAWLGKSSGANDAVHHFTVAFKQAPALSGTSLCNYITLYDGTTAQCSVVFRSDGAIVLASGGPTGTALATYTGAVTINNQWFAFEFEVVVNNTTGSFRVRTNNATSDSFVATGLNTRNSANNYANKIQAGLNANLGGNLDLDDFLWRSDPTSVPWVGDIRCYARMPASDVQKVFSQSGTAYPYTPQIPTGSVSAITAGQAKWFPFTPPVSGSCGLITLPLAPSTPGAGNWKGAIFAVGAGGLPGLVLGTATAFTAPPVGTVSYVFPTPVALTGGTQYFFGYAMDTAGGSMNVGATAVNTYFLNSGFAAFPANNPAATMQSANPVAFTVYLSGVGNYQFVADPQEDGAASYVYDNNVGDADFYGIASIPVTPAAVVAVTTRGFVQKSDAGSRTGAMQLKSGSTTVQSSNGSTLSTTFAWCWRTDVNDPATGAAWTPTGVNNVQIGPTVLS